MMTLINNKKHAGFTLIELMVVVAIVAILATIALPSYQDSVQKTRRSDAQAALFSAATAQEKWYFQRGSYSNNVDEIGGNAGTLLSSEGYYTITINNNVNNGRCVGGGGVAFNCFILTATPVVPGPQANDTTCATMTLDQTGRKQSLDNLRVETTAICWP